MRTTKTARHRAEPTRVDERKQFVVLRVVVAALLATATGVVGRAEPPPPADLELLEYLGTLARDGKGWVGPEEVGAMTAMDGKAAQRQATTQPAPKSETREEQHRVN